MPGFDKVLVANRGEIAVRIFRTLRELEIGSVAVYSDADRGRLHTRAADEAYRIGPGPADESYLRIDVLVATALRAGAQAIHPGYGFLAENAAFARAVEEAGLTWIGPPPAAIELMGSKTEARTTMKAAGVPIIPGATDPVRTVAEVVALGDEIGYPLIIKAAAGGGGKGMELVHDADEAERAFEAAQRQGLKYFADDAVYVERYLEDPRHVEAQVLADAHGTVLFLGERDCTIQRRHQKLVEETPSPAVDEELRARIGKIAVDAARAAGYRSAGTIEGLLTAGGDYYFMEMNTRIQVEHTVTELVTGLDLIREQVLIAQGEPLSLQQEDVVLRGHAIECRINAEDVTKGFLPAPGLVTAYEEPAGPGVRVDSGVRAGDEISGLYDPMIAKLVVWDEDRELARRRMLRALSEFQIEGPRTLIPLHRQILEHPDFIAGGLLHEFVESGGNVDGRPGVDADRGPASVVREARTLPIEVDGKRFDVTVTVPEHQGRTRLRARRAAMAERERTAHGHGDVVRSPMQGTVLTVGVAEGDTVSAGDVLIVVEAMKMENEIVAHGPGVVEAVEVAAGDQVTSGQALVRLGASEAV
jgi:acetyl-CoA/propionyl-CoA/long-chain acyl-CoA carboxylase, biotin carboxylase, biotin carboxyl carrier protein